MKRVILLLLLLAMVATLGWAQCPPAGPTCVVVNQTPAPPDGSTGNSYSFQFTASGGAGGGEGPYSFNVSTAQQPPPGLQLNQQGLLSGVPTQTGQYTFGVVARDSQGRASSTQFFTMNIFTGTGGGVIQITNPQAGNASVANAFVGNSYFFQFQATGGNPNPSYNWTGFVPVSGLTLYSNGQILGTPAVGSQGNYSFNVSVSDGSGNQTNATFNINVSASGGSGFQISTTSVPNGTVGVFYQTQFFAQNGSGSYQWSVIQGQVPPGLQFFSSNQQGQLSGTPTNAGNYTFTVSVFDNQTSQTATRQFTISISGTTGSGFQISTTFVPSGTVGVFYSTQFNAVNGSGSYQWSATVGQLPPGLQFFSSNQQGQLSGTPTSAGNYTFTVTVFDNQTSQTASRQFTAQISGTTGSGFQISTTAVPSGVPGNFYQFQFQAANGSGSYNWSYQGQIPPGLQFFNSGQLSGTPTTVGNYTFTVSVVDNQTSQSASRQYTMQVNSTGGTGGVSITTTSVPNAAVGIFYSFQFTASGCNVCVWSLASGSGSLPP